MLSEDKDEIREILVKYCTFGDNGCFNELADLFTKDGVWQGRLGRAEGRAAIEALMVRINPPPGEGPVRRHLVSNVVVTVEGTIANASSTFVLLRESDTGPQIGAVGAWTDTLVKEGGRWLIRCRIVSPEIVGEQRLKS